MSKVKIYFRLLLTFWRIEYIQWTERSYSIDYVNPLNDRIDENGKTRLNAFRDLVINFSHLKHSDIPPWDKN